jgi:DNA-binding transcriptional MerR regulator
MADPVIPNKLYFPIGEVCRLSQLEPYVLRFWEREFPTLSPAKGANGRRMYRKKDVEMVFTIKNLLYQQGFTIAGARNTLGRRTRNLPQETLQEVRRELQNILTILARKC